MKGKNFMAKIFKKIITLTGLSLTGMYAFNKYIEENNTPQISSKNNKTYHWKDMDITYTIKGMENQKPLLLIHNLYPSSSKEEWYKIDSKLSKIYRVYEIDLPGCGKSDKPNFTYINYMYVQLIQDFIKEIIKEKTNLCATAYSSSFTIMTARINPEIIDKIIILNPTSIEKLVEPITKLKELKKKIISLPILGEFLYNCRMSRASIADDYKYVYFYHHRNVSSNMIDIAYFNSHYKKSCWKNQAVIYWEA